MHKILTIVNAIAKSGRHWDASMHQACTADALMSASGLSLPQDPFVLVPSDRALLGLERQPTLHTFARNFSAFLAAWMPSLTSA